MATKTTKKLNPYTEKKNSEPPVKVEEAQVVGEETELPETKAMIPVKEFAMPIANPEQLQKGMELYQKCLNALVKAKDVVMVDNKPHGKKIAVNKINRVFGVSTEVLRSFLEEHIAYRDHWSKGYHKTILVHKGEKYTIAKAWVKAILPNGQFCTRGGAVSETERRFAHFPHDLTATAETRAMKNAAENLLGIEFEMMEEGENMGQAPKTPQRGNQGAQGANKSEPEEKIEYQEYEANGKKYYRAIKNGETIREGIELDEWKPMFKSRPVKYGGGIPSSPNMPASDKQVSFIADKIKKTGIAPEDVSFVLNNRFNGKEREVMLIDATKGDCWDILTAIGRRKLKIIKGKDKSIKAIIES